MSDPTTAGIRSIQSRLIAVEPETTEIGIRLSAAPR